MQKCYICPIPANDRRAGMRKCHLCLRCLTGKTKANHPMPQQTLPSRSGHPEQAVPF